MGPLNPQWRGDDAVDESLHDWLREHHPKTGTCEKCGTCPDGRGTEYAFRHHPYPYTRKREDYMELCRRCHARFDRKGSKLTIEKAREIRSRRAAGESARALMAAFGIAEPTVYAVLSGRIWVD